MRNRKVSNYRWYILTLVSLTATFVFAMPMMSMPVLFKEISDDLNLSLVQIGAVWGTIPLAGVFVMLPGGLLSDRFGAKRLLTLGCLLAGAAGILRGMSDNFFTLVATMFLFGLLMTLTGPGMIKAISVWFSDRRLGLANGVFSMSMGLGFMLGALISATLLSPLLHGWRNVMFFYGSLSVAVSVLWLFSRSMPEGDAAASSNLRPAPFRETLGALLRNRQIWLLGLIMLCQLSAVQGMLGYLPLYLRDSGWSPVAADGALSAFHAFSTLGTVPLTLLSDRFSSRKRILIIAVIATALGIGLLSVANGWSVWAAVIISGVIRDGFMAVHTTMIIETEGVGARNAGTATGITHTVSLLGEFASPPIGNGLAVINPRLSFVFWGGLAAAAMFAFIPLREKARKHLGQA